MEKNNQVALDKVDKKIIRELELNARAPISQIAKKVHVSRKIAETRINKLKKQGIYDLNYCMIDASKLGLILWRIYFSARFKTEEQRKSMLSYLEKHPRVMYFFECAGEYDFIIILAIKTPYHASKFFGELQNKFENSIIKFANSINVDFDFYTRGYLTNTKSKRILFCVRGQKQEKISQSQANILRSVLEHPGESHVSIAKRLNKNVKTVTTAIRELEKKKIILIYRPFIYAKKFGFGMYKLLIYLDNQKSETIAKLVEWCKQHPNITLTSKSVGPWQFEITAEVDNHSNLFQIITKLKNEFSEMILDYDILLITKSHRTDSKVLALYE